jgi:predicted RNA-binding Zn ribbon-like protein
MTQDRPAPFFVGGHPALDFLNTTATPRDARVEWLAGGKDLLDWLEAAGLIEAGEAARFRGPKDRRALDEVARKAREFREWLRGFVTAHLGEPLRATAALGPLNRLLALENSFLRVEVAGGRLVSRRVRRWESPGELLLPLAEAAADLVSGEDFRLLIRACEGGACTLLFLDRTKARGRRWCSMAVCGNRAKAAAHRARRGEGR